ncbi:unnamed protein product [Trichobilharzia szidati]|nr:unnamed protein product [Trichobilharzia szidati]
MSRLFFYRRMKDVINRLPGHYKRRYLENQDNLANEKFLATSLIAKEETGAVFPNTYFDSRLNVVYPPESQKCLWGGEGIIGGYWEKKNQRPRFPKTWSPVLMEQLFHSEILNRWMVIIVSETALKQIEESGGFDFYILSTPESKLKSRLGMHLKRDMLITLAKAEENGNIPSSLQKFSRFIIPLEEAEWIGLTLEEAVKKQMKIEHEIARSQVKPLKLVLAENLIDKLINSVEKEKGDEGEKSSGYLSKFFNRQTSDSKSV